VPSVRPPGAARYGVPGLAAQRRCPNLTPHGSLSCWSRSKSYRHTLPLPSTAQVRPLQRKLLRVAPEPTLSASPSCSFSHHHSYLPVIHDPAAPRLGVPPLMLAAASQTGAVHHQMLGWRHRGDGATLNRSYCRDAPAMTSTAAATRRQSCGLVVLRRMSKSRSVKRSGSSSPNAAAIVDAFSHTSRSDILDRLDI